MTIKFYFNKSGQQGNEEGGKAQCGQAATPQTKMMGTQ
jgi:hypothetical protein